MQCCSITSASCWKTWSARPKPPPSTSGAEVDPSFADCHYNLALLCEALGKPQEAIRHMAQYRRLMQKK